MHKGDVGAVLTRWPRAVMALLFLGTYALTYNITPQAYTVHAAEYHANALGRACAPLVVALLGAGANALLARLSATYKTRGFWPVAMWWHLTFTAILLASRIGH